MSALLAWTFVVSGGPQALAAENCTVTTLNFSSGTFNGWNIAGVGEVVPTISEEHAQSGKSVHFKLTGAQIRSELILGGTGNTEFWPTHIEDGKHYKFSWYTYIPVGGMKYGGPGHHNTIWQLHGESNGVGTEFSLELGKYPTGEEKLGLYLAGYNQAGEYSNYFLSGIAEGALHQISIDFTASNKAAGAYKIYLDGTLVAEATGVKTIMGAEPLGYVKLGLYRGVEGTSELFDSLVEFTEYCPPTGITEAPSNIEQTKATLNGKVNPNGTKTTYHFEYGKTTAYGTSVPVPSESVGSGIEAVAKSKVISGLLPETTYHFRIVAENSEGTAYGAHRSFTTLAITPSYVSSFGKEGSGNGEFLWPLGVAIDSSGNMWVADYYGRIQKFNAQSEYLGQFGKTGTGNGEFNVPIGMAMTSSGDLWIVDSGNNRVQKFNAKGEYLAQFGGSGSGNGKFTEPWGIAIAPNGHLWISDQGNDRIEEFTASGEFVRQVHGAGYGGTGNGEFSEPRGLTTDSSGNVWVADTANNRVQEVSPTGEYLTKFGTKGSGNGEFDRPIAVEVKATGNLFVAEENNGRVQEMSPSGEYLAQFGGFAWPNFLTFGGGGTFFVVNPGYRKIERWKQPARPEATTQSASKIKTTEATLNGTVNPSGASTTYHFEYGKTTAYGTSVPVPSESVGSGIEAVAKSKDISGLSPETTYHFRIVAENSEGTAYGEDASFTTSTASALSLLSITEPFNGSSESVSNFGTNWTALGWATSGTPKGEDTSSGWRPLAAYPTVNGAFYGTTVTDTGSGIAAVATMAVNPANASRYFSLWLDMSTPSSTRAGYELRFTDVSAGVYNVKLSRWKEGSESVLASKSSYSFANGNSFALVDQGGTVSAWTDTGSGFGQILSASDSTFEGGKTAVEGAGNITRLTNFKTGSL